MIRAFRAIPANLREWLTWIQGIESQGTFRATLTGFATPPTGTVEWIKIGRRVTLYAASHVSGTSNSTSMTLTGVPAEVRPQTTVKANPVIFINNSGNHVGSASIDTTGVITFALGSPLDSAGLTASGTKGIQTGWSFSYMLET